MLRQVNVDDLIFDTPRVRVHDAVPKIPAIAIVILVEKMDCIVQAMDVTDITTKMDVVEKASNIVIEEGIFFRGLILF